MILTMIMRRMVKVVMVVMVVMVLMLVMVVMVLMSTIAMQMVVGGKGEIWQSC